MGGSGSGNTSARDARPTTAERARLDIRAWRRADLLAGRGDAGEWREWCPGGGLRVQVVDLAPAPSPGAPPALALRLARTRQPGGAAAVEVHSWIDLAWTPCQFGGHRPWFVCPGEAGGAPCGRQAAILYDAGDGFLCRRCVGLAYPSTRLDGRDRLLARSRRLRGRLGGGQPLAGLPRKPPRMYWTTYDRLCREILTAEAAYLAGAERRGAGLEARSPRRRRRAR